MRRIEVGIPAPADGSFPWYVGMFLSGGSVGGRPVNARVVEVTRLFGPAGAIDIIELEVDA